MRRAFCAILSLVVVFSAGFFVGCAQKRASVSDAATTPPSDELLPNIEESANPYPVSVGVPRKPEEPAIVFVPKFEPVELTKEEKKAMGIAEPRINFLEFYKPTPTFENLRAIPLEPSPITAIYGAGGGSASTAPSSVVTGVGMDLASIFGYAPSFRPSAAIGHDARTTTGIGQESRPMVGYGEASYRAGHQPMKDR